MDDKLIVKESMILDNTGLGFQIIISGVVDLVVPSFFSKKNEWVRLKERHPKLLSLQNT